jgi:hypothetical protein
MGAATISAIEDETHCPVSDSTSRPTRKQYSTGPATEAQPPPAESGDTRPPLAVE